MICEMCTKHKASVHLTEIINDQVTKLNLCEYCAKQKGTNMEQHFGIADLLQGLAGVGDSEPTTTVHKVRCVNCGLTFDKFKKIGRLGCAMCYEAFEEHLTPLLKRIHSSVKHIGKVPASFDDVADKKPRKRASAITTEDVKATLKKMRLQLKHLIESEDYEKAAQLRDKIKKIEAKLKK
ncbi:MAG: protein arginine kinase activator [Candidatus Omnitrophota bacterium]|jgi:protein arginine kinase activator